MTNLKRKISERGAAAIETALLFVVAPIFFFGLFDVTMMVDSVSISTDTALQARLSAASRSRNLGIDEGDDLPIRRGAALSAARRAALDLELFRGDSRLRDITNRTLANSRYSRFDISSEREADLATTTRRRIARLTRGTDITLNDGTRRRVNTEIAVRPAFRSLWVPLGLNTARARTPVPEAPTAVLSRDLS